MPSRSPGHAFIGRHGPRDQLQVRESRHARHLGPRTKRCAGVARWNYAASADATASVACRGAKGGSSAAPRHLVATQGDRLVRVVLAPDGVDRPDRLDVVARGTGHRISSWPLIDRPARVVLFGKIAILSATKRDALYALRISDGRIAMLGVTRASDRPIIGRDGVVYQDGLSLKAQRLAPNQVTLKLVPLAAVERQLSLADRQIRTHWRITAIGMDGRRVAFAVHDPTGRCDVVKFSDPSLALRRACDPSERGDVSPQPPPRRRHGPCDGWWPSDLDDAVRQ